MRRLARQQRYKLSSITFTPISGAEPDWLTSSNTFLLDTCAARSHQGCLITNHPMLIPMLIHRRCMLFALGLEIARHRQLVPNPAEFLHEDELSLLIMVRHDVLEIFSKYYSTMYAYNAWPYCVYLHLRSKRTCVHGTGTPSLFCWVDT